MTISGQVTTGDQARGIRPAEYAYAQASVLGQKSAMEDASAMQKRSGWGRRTDREVCPTHQFKSLVITSLRAFDVSRDCRTDAAIWSDMPAMPSPSKACMLNVWLNV